jgi:hypothetical protein
VKNDAGDRPIADRRGARFGLAIGLNASLLAFIVTWLFGQALWALIGACSCWTQECRLVSFRIKS